MKKFLFCVFNLLVLFAPDFVYFPKWTWVISLCGLLVFLDRDTARSLGLFSKNFLVIICFWVVSFCMSLSVSAFHGTYDFSYIALLIGLLLSVLRAIFVAYVGVKVFDLTSDNYVSIIVDVCVLYAIVTVIFISLPTVKMWWFNNVINPVQVSIPDAYPFRIGIEGFAGFSTTQVFSLGLLLSAFLIVSQKSSFLLPVSKYVIIVSSSFLYGRISIVPISLSLLYLGLAKNKKRTITALVIIGGLLFIGTSTLLAVAETNALVYNWSQWAFEGIINLLKIGQFTTNSSSSMFRNMFFKIDPKTLFLGDGWYTTDTGGYYMATDVGFMRPILYFGVFGLLSNYGMLVTLIGSIRNFYRVKGMPTAVHLVTFVMINAFIFEIKGEAFHRFIYCLLPLYLVSRHDSGNFRNGGYQ